MFDFHSHILPRLDDGSRCIEESVAMLRESWKQGVSGIAATPHFYADIHAPDRWIEHRNHALQSLLPHMTKDMPLIRLGAEVHYYEGICRSEQILQLRIEGTNLLLLEMPVGHWTSHMCDTLIELSRRQGVTVLLAHIERYLPFQSVETWMFLRRNGILMQASAEFFLERRNRRKAIRMLKNDEIHLLGSDCHNMETRRPCLGNAADIIAKKLGADALKTLAVREEMVLREEE